MQAHIYCRIDLLLGLDQAEPGVEQGISSALKIKCWNAYGSHDLSFL